MKNFETVLCTFLAAGIAFCAQAEDKAEPKEEKKAELVNPQTVFATKSQAVLFKIHDIKPVLNTDGVVTSCEYEATFFNRTKKAIRQAKIEFGWTDRVSDLYMIEGAGQSVDSTLPDQKDAPKQPQKPLGPAESVGEITSNIDLPSLGVLKQVTVKGYADTEKCFALFDNVKFKVKDCVVLSGDEEKDNVRRDQISNQVDGCAGIFSYIDSRNPEYYGEFKEVAYAELQDRAKTAEEKEKEAIAQVNKTIDENISKTSELITSIE